jgi:predicted TPR repeat methyltransferase
VDALRDVLPSPDRALDVLDAGCGTGLCAPLIRAHARQLTGVDLSSGMIEKARSRGDYDVLEVAELTAFLQAHPLVYDLVLSADTLIYFGELQDAMMAAHAALRPNGWLGFTLEVKDGDDDGTELMPSGRYQHTRAYVERVVTGAGFANVHISADTLRKEGGQEVNGWVVLAQRTAPVCVETTMARG